MRKFLPILLATTLLLATFLGCSQVQAQDTYSIELQGFVWNHTTLNALIVTPTNDSWWSPSYTNVALRAIGQWNDALAAFAANYSDYSYLSDLRILPTVSNTTAPGYDIYVEWTLTPLSNTTDEIGLSQIFADYRNTINNCTVSLAVHAFHGEVLSEVDMQNVALHELGHSLGLGHSNYTGDLMDAYYTMGSGPEHVSTLDAYGVATLFAWETNTTEFYPIDGWLKENSVVLPQDIPYKGLPVTPQNAAPQTLADNPVVQTLILMFEILIHPEILAIVILVILAFVIVALVTRRKRG